MQKLHEVAPFAAPDLSPPRVRPDHENFHVVARYGTLAPQPVVLWITLFVLPSLKNHVLWVKLLIALSWACMLHVLVALETVAVRSSVEEVPAVGIPE